MSLDGMVWVIVVTDDFTISLLVTYPQHHAKTMQQENSCAKIIQESLLTQSLKYSPWPLVSYITLY